MSSERRVLKADEIFITEDLVRVWVPTPEWKPAGSNGEECGVYVTTLDGRDKEQWEDEITDAKGNRDANKVGMLMATALSRSCVDGQGNRIFSVDQVGQIAKKSGVVLARLWAAFRKLNVITDADVSEMVKN